MNFTRRKHIVSISVIVAAIGLIAMGAIVAGSDKILDYNDPRFDISKFSFEDYPSLREMENFAYSVCLPQDAHITNLENIFLKYGGARKKLLGCRDDGSCVLFYFYPPSTPKRHPPDGSVDYVIQVLTSKSGRVLDCNVNDFTESPTLLSSEDGLIPALRNKRRKDSK